MTEKKIDIKSYTLQELRDYMVSIGEKSFRAVQLYDWMHVKLAGSCTEMGNIPKALKEKLENACDYTSLRIVQELML